MLHKIKLLKNPKTILLLILLSTAFLRLYRLDYPKNYVFDEVYHAFTAKEYLNGNKEAWNPWGKPPPGVAYEWTHPPLAKQIMAGSMLVLHNTDSWAWRLPGSLLGILSVFLVYLLGKVLFKNERISLMAAFIFSLDGLTFVQSRTGMNDIYYVTFVLISLLFFLNKKTFLSAIFLGLALCSKWAAIYLILIYFPFLLYQRRVKDLIFFILVPFGMYILSYTHYFLMGYKWNDFIQLQNQMWWYHTNLKATHAYSSPWWSWPLNLYPVWYFVDYQKDSIANIFASGNPVVFWLGSTSIVFTAFQAVKKRSINLLLIVLGFTVFWLPWALSPRIMFLYHFSPSVPFLSISLAYQLNNLSMINKRGRLIAISCLVLIVLCFILIYPFLTAIHIPKNLVGLFFSTNLSKKLF